MKRIFIALMATTCLPSSLAYAQSDVPAESASAAANNSGDIIVTARKRAETSLAVPVVISAIGGDEIANRAIVNVEGIARVVPQLLVGPDSGVQGGTIAMRGISGPAGNSFGDQAIAFNIDGVQVAKSSVRRMAQMDLAQVEVLKGPQALFYGKNSPGGIITMRTADPTASFEAKASAGYEFNAREIRTEGYISGPISDTLGIRLAGFFSDMQGDVRNRIPDGAYLKSTSYDRVLNATDWAGRLTFKWEPSDRFNARLKVSYANTENSGPGSQFQRIGCTLGTPQSGEIDDCRANKFAAVGGPGPLLIGQPGEWRDGSGYTDQWQTLSSLEMNYDLSDQLTLTSVTGLYAFKVKVADNYSADYALDLASYNRLSDRELSQELRLQSDFGGPFDFVLGLFGTDTHQTTEGRAFLYAAEASAVPLLVANRFPGTLRTLNSVSAFAAVQEGDAISGYGQAILRPIDTVEVTLGGRYSSERKFLPLARAGSAFLPLDASTDRSPTVRKRVFNDFSPEVTVAFRPDGTTNLFASYKEGFLSGGYNVTSTSFVGDVSYDPEVAKGFEIGAKKEFLDNALRVNLAAYSYKIDGLQVTTFINGFSFLRNAAGARVKGIEGDFAYRTPLDGLTLTGAFSYNHARYTSFPNAACFRGQTPAQGCSLNPVVGANVQDLTGRPLIQTPKFSGNLGFNYETPVSDNLKLGLSSNASYSSSYFADAFADPRGKMPRYALLDGSLRLGDADDKWELALIGRNLTNRRYWTTSLDTSFTGSGTGTAEGIRADKHAGVSRGREVMLRATIKFGG